MIVLFWQQICNRSLTDRTQDSDSCDVGSIPAGCILKRRQEDKEL